MIAAQKFNSANSQEMPTIYGSITTGTQWQFLKLTGKYLTSMLMSIHLTHSIAS
jgi:hypothetical protein